MNQPQTSPRNWDTLLILLLAPAPLTGIALILLSVLLIANPDVIDLGGDEESAAVAPAPTLAISSQGAAIATLNAVPQRTDIPQPTAAPLSAEQSAEIAAASGYSAEQVSAGERNYLGVCSACHGTDAHGITGLGKTLVSSEFINSQTDDSLVQFIIAGRPIWDAANTTGVEMPARGGNPGLSDEDIHNIVAYIRVLNGGVGAPGGSSAATTNTTGTETTATTENQAPAEFTPIDIGALTGSGSETTGTTNAEGAVEFTPIDIGALTGSNTAETSTEFTTVDVSAFLAGLGVVLPEPIGYVEMNGEVLYEQRCAACHGGDGLGVEGRGGNLTESDLLQNQDTETLLHMIHYGSPLWSADNESGYHMPEMGGYPHLTEAQMNVLIEYLYTLNSAE